MNLLRFVLRRMVFAVLVLASVLTITFVLSHLIPGDVIQAWLGKEAATQPKLAALTAAKYHLNDSIPVQYYYYLVNMLQGNLGYSPSRGFQPVTSVIAQTLPYTLQIVFFAFIMTIAIGVVLGVVAARYNGTVLDKGIRIFYLGAYSSPPYFIGVVLLIVLSFVLNIPSGYAANPNLTPPTAITGLPIFDSLIEGNFAYFESGLVYVFLPALTLAVATFGLLTRVARSSLLEVMQTDYIRTARAKGLDEGSVFYRHALPNAAVSLITISSLLVTFLVTGTIFVEDLFGYPGMGLYVVKALAGTDYPGIMATTLVFAIIIITTNLAADILYAIADPQIRLG
ncbi:MAG: ABC transporter permease [Thaumarchaeota archaeon]|nr:ABC transporter permease [Nitrososphaerota archaeon]